ncbi:shufflon system plasmid conjugative transfer pilus tip adhesin PilV [Burkholderia stagnalis]|nr:shufflon system plasmid conjugative transfer pilus tip adhesin PilV [Burkholderia stagnalis]RQQ20927.1 shufflon system plasmid conjugative transfer pilus tip adhesin PilV [Burkholderia stagnalis]RQQ36047.1 shufflon system plasmid conjugative transfer pilus tip adhesin PilV [Burkholderia stagnalis]RQQ39705.1 shufflon system plasmid conjugative transfer pilus tip adhesin PilV [Burkholderia stagnalis]RQQ40524.1 shufflon system plasmid conjugative transfer pilus tip adhesin PilV [Burkholderia st
MSSRRRARGFSLIEVLGALAIAAVMLAGIAMLVDTSLDDVRAQQAAQYQSQVTAAATRALKRDYDAWWQRANKLTPIVMKLTDLQTTNDLPAALRSTNAYGQHTCVLIKRSAGSVGLDALVVTTGGETIGDKELGLVAASAGPGGGSISKTFPNEARGAFDAWRMPLGAFLGGSSPKCDPADAAPPNAGHLANEIFFNGPGQQINSDYLYRVGVTGHPEANAMQVPIWLTQKFAEGNLDEANCGTAGNFTNGKLGADTFGNLLSCQNGVWRSTGGHWKDPVETTNKLPNDELNHVGDVRLTLDKFRAYAWTGAAWQALAVDQNDNLIVPGVVSANQYEITGRVVVNTPCAADKDRPDAGLISMGKDGQVLSCQDGKWLPQSGIKIGSTDMDCQILMATPGATDFSQCSYTYTGGYPNGSFISYAEDGTYTYRIERPVTLDNNGLISVSAYMHMSYAVCNSKGWEGQMRLVVDIVDIQSNKVIAHGDAQSPKLIDDAATINVTLNQAAEPRRGYKVVLSSNWATYDRNATPWTSNYCNSKKTFLQTPLATGWTINSFY